MDAATGKRGRDTERTGAPHAFWVSAARSVLPLLSLIVSGCSIHPVQQDVTGVPPVDIIHHIRCETRLAIEDKAIERQLTNVCEIIELWPSRDAMAGEIGATRSQVSKWWQRDNLCAAV